MGDRSVRGMQDTKTRPPIHEQNFCRIFPVACRVSDPRKLVGSSSTLSTDERETRVVKLFEEDRDLTGSETLCDLAVRAKRNKKLKIKIHIRDLRRSVKDKHHLSLNKLPNARCEPE